VSNYFAGPGNSNDGAGGISTITGVARSVSVNITPFVGMQVEIVTPAGYDRSLTFQVSHDDPNTLDASKNWVNVPYVDLSTPTVGAASGAISPGATQRKLYQILALGRFFSINQTGGTTGNAQWRLIAHEDFGGVSQSFGGGGSMALLSASYQRPNDSNPYIALDAIADSTSAPTVLTFANAARVSGGSGYITAARIVTDQKANVAQFRLHLFNATPTAINDNSPYLFLYADRAKYLGYIDLGPLATEDSTNSTGANAQDNTVRVPYVAAATSLFGLLETKSAFTPTAQQNFFIYLTVDQN
jgi:hypothetical protein